jgi:hypothetical protein
MSVEDTSSIGKQRVEALAHGLAGCIFPNELELALRKIFEKQHLKAIDKWIAMQGDPSIDRRDAVLRLVEIGLNANGRKREKAAR